IDYFSGFISLIRDSHLPTAWYSSVNPSFCNRVVILAFNDRLFWLYGSVLSKLVSLAIAYITLSTVLYDWCGTSFRSSAGLSDGSFFVCTSWLSRLAIRLSLLSSLS